ncbi:MAG: hypothetical protein WC584_02920 [Candidatus Pacearchaeota archaeon]
MEKVSYEHAKDAVIESIAYNLNIDLSDARFYLTIPSCEQRRFAEMKHGNKTIIRERLGLTQRTH